VVGHFVLVMLLNRSLLLWRDRNYHCSSLDNNLSLLSRRLIGGKSPAVNMDDASAFGDFELSYKTFPLPSIDLISKNCKTSSFKGPVPNIYPAMVVGISGSSNYK